MNVNGHDETISTTTLLGPYFSRLPIELVLEIAFTTCSSLQSNYATLLLLCRRFFELCRLSCLPFVPVVLETVTQIGQFAEYLDRNQYAAPCIRQLWMVKDYHDILFKCTNLVSLACDGHDLVPIVSADTFRHTALTNLTIMGLWDFWAPFVRARHGRTLCGQLHKLWLLDHLFLRGIETEWLDELRELYYWSIEGRGKDQFRDEVGLLKGLKRLERFGVIMHCPSSSVFRQLEEIGDRRLEVVEWGKRSEVVEWMGQRV
ncbi:hypothetical protein AN958_12297 [Leucoagaricus sp. SymC.cos]|nr:hypothetical protein AN958_12297 [Leucoagaricus sp. SymC.cos]